MSLTILLPLLVAAPPNYEGSIQSLEEAYQAIPNPDILLSIASTYESWSGHCKETIQTYRRFFDACKGCSSLAQASDRFDLALERCVANAEEEVELRRQFVLPNKKKPKRVEADATRSEVVELLRHARSIDRAETGKLFVTLIEAGFEAPPKTLNMLREQAWEVLLRKDASAEEVLMLIGRLRLVHPEGYQALLNDLVEAQNRQDQDGLNSIRIQAIATLRDRSSKEPKLSETLTGCRANPSYELGFVTINTRPWSEVYVNGARVGTTPVAKYKVVAGCVTIRAISPSTGKEKVVNATIRPNRVTRLSFDMTQK